MIRIRSRTGEVHELDEGFRFVEICDTQGQVARVLYIDDQGVTRVVGAQDPEARRYAQAFKTKFCPVIHV